MSPRRPATQDPSAPDHSAVALTTAAVTVLLVLAYERTFAMLFVLNFSTAGPGPTLLLIALVATGFAYRFIWRTRWPHRPIDLDIAVGTLALSTIIAHTNNPTIALIAALVAGFAATPLLATFVSRSRDISAFGITLGLLIHTTARAWNGTLPLDATGNGLLMLALLVLGTLIAWWGHDRTKTHDAILDNPGPLPAPRLAMVYALLILEAAFLLHPAAVARWADINVSGATAASAGGLAIGAALGFLPRLPGWLRWFPTLLLAGGITWLTYGSGYGVVALLVAQIGAVRILARASTTSPGGPMADVGTRTGSTQLVAVLFVFLHASAPSWAFLPAFLQPLTHGTAAFWLFLLAGFATLVATPGIIQHDPEVHP